MAIDCDSQRASISTWIGPDEAPETQLADILTDPKDVAKAVIPSRAEGVDLLPSGPRTLEIERELTARGTMPIVFKRIFRDLGNRVRRSTKPRSSLDLGAHDVCAPSSEHRRHDVELLAIEDIP